MIEVGLFLGGVAVGMGLMLFIYRNNKSKMTTLADEINKLKDKLKKKK